MHACYGVPELSRLSFASSMLFNGGEQCGVRVTAVIGWFTTIAATSETIRCFFDFRERLLYASELLLLT